ncbi:MAG: hypothetical protein LIO93_09860 [Bacteroidales bacterium]|nr:hypothetical protein [Bacteroidales bacterium]
MKIYCYLFLLPILCLLTSCNKDEGFGGSSSLEGYVYKLRYWEKDPSVIVDTVPAIDVRVRLTFGNNLKDYQGDDLRTDGNGLYRFDFLRSGDYIVSAYSEDITGQEVRNYVVSKVSGSLSMADTIFITTPVKRGIATIRGYVEAHYYDKGRKVAEGPAMGERVYLQRKGALTAFDDVRIGDQGVFEFTNIIPGEYEVWVVTEDPNTEMMSAVKKEIKVEDGELYEFEEDFVIIITV